MIKVAAAIQASLDHIRRQDLLAINRWANRHLPARVDAPHACELLTCERAAFWRSQYAKAQDDADRFARQLTASGRRPAPLLDGHQASYAGSRP